MDPPSLKLCIYHGNVASLRALCDKEIPLGSDTPLHEAVHADKIDFVEEISSMKPDFARSLGRYGFTPLHIASIMGKLEITRTLVTQEPDLCKIKDKDGWTPLHRAARHGKVEVIEELLSKCPEVREERTPGGQTALDLAVENCRFEACKKLVERVSDDGDADELLTAKDDDGNTISQLATASEQRQKDTIDVVSSDQLEEQTNVKPQANQGKKATTKPGSMQQSSQSEDVDSSSSSMWSQMGDKVVVVASLIATVTYQAGLSPPQTIWSNNMKLNERCTSHHSFFSSTNLCPMTAYYLFMSFNTCGFFCSILLIFFFRKESVVRVLLPVALLSMTITYVTLSVTMSPNGLSFLLIYVITFNILLYCMLAVGMVETIFHKARAVTRGAIEKRRSSSASVSKAGV